MDDDVLPSTASRRLAGSVIEPETASWLGRSALDPCAALEHPHRVAVVDEPPHDRRADEPGRAGDEDPHASKFFQ